MALSSLTIEARYQLRPILFAIFTFAFCQNGIGADWPTYRHDHRRSAVSPEQPDIDRLCETWQWRSPIEPLSAWPGPARWDAYAGIRGLRAMRNYDPVFHVIAAENAIFFGSNTDDSVRRVNAKTGVVEWTFTADGPVRIAPEYFEERVYFGSDDGYAYCVDATSGQLVWRTRPVELKRYLLNDGRLVSRHPVRSGVLVTEGRAHFTASLTPWESSYLCAVDAATGDREGGYVMNVGEGKTLEGALLASKSDLVLPQGRVAPLVFDRKSGESKGSLQGGGGSFVLLTEDDHILHGPGNKQGVISDSSSDSRKRVASYENGNAIVVEGTTSYLLSDKSLAAYDRTGKKIRWLVPADAPYDLILVGEVLFAGGNGHVTGYSKEDGSQVWSANVEGKAHGLAFADGRLYATTDSGVIHCFAAGDKRIDTSKQSKEQPTVEIKPDSPPIKPVRERGLLDRWVFQRNGISDPKVSNQARPLTATIAGRYKVEPCGELEALELDGATNDIVVLQQFERTESPAKSLTAEAWVRIDAAAEWGGLIGIAQDNGAYERGWLLGYRNDKFGFALAGEKGNDRLTWLTSPESFALGSWHHVCGTYDGVKQKLFVDGKLVAESDQQKGEIRYPEEARYVLGAYWDKDEHFRLSGAVHEIRLYDRALDERMIARHAAEKRDLLPASPVTKEANFASLAWGPMLRFNVDGGATVEWETREPSATRLTVQSQSSLLQEHVDDKKKRLHLVELEPLARSTLLSYRIYVEKKSLGDAKPKATSDDEVWLATKDFGLDTHFNYARMNGSTATVDESGPANQQGVAIVIDDIDAAEKLSAESMLYVTLISRDPQVISKARTKWVESSKYGPRLTAREWDNQLPTRFAACVIAPKEIAKAKLTELLHPGGELFIDGKSVFVAEPLAGAGAWTHMYGRADNSAFGGETLGGADSYEDLTLHWLGRPGPRYQSDRGNRKPAPLAVGGRLYMQGLNRIIALNAYSGVILWSLELPTLQRFNIPRDTCNWCADEKHLWLAMDDRVWQLDGATGKTINSRPIPRPDAARDGVTWGYLSRQDDQLFGSAVAAGGHYLDWWGGASWYDGKSGEGTYKVCSMNLVCTNATTGEKSWEFKRGAIVNPTITMVGDLVIFAENPNLDPTKQSRFGDSIFNGLQLVALDRKTGNVRWEQPIEQRVGTVACYVAATSETIVVTTSSNGQFDVATMKTSGGDKVWSKTLKWEVDHHGKHLSRPAIMGDTVVMRPYVIDIHTGELIDRPFPKGHQCGTYTCTDRALFLRAGDLTMWNLDGNASTKLNRVRPDCWISTIPALGMLLSPEGGGGCSCGSWLETSMGFLPNVHAKRRVPE